MNKTKDDLMADVIKLYDTMIEFGFNPNEDWNLRQLLAFVPFADIKGDSVYFDAVAYALQNERKEKMLASIAEDDIIER